MDIPGTPPNNSNSSKAPSSHHQDVNDMIASPYKDVNNMVAKVTIETGSGTTSKYYLLYRDQCYSLGSLCTGALGGLGVGFYSRVFFEQTRPKGTLPFNIPEVNIAVKYNGKSINVPLLFGKTVYWRLASRSALSAILYSALQCQFQGNWYRRSYLDCGLAGAVTGALLGLRGVPGRLQGAGIGAAGFGAFSLVCRFLFL